MSYLTLEKAANYIKHRKDIEIDANDLLILGCHGHLLITSEFCHVMRNLVTHADEDVLGLLVIPPRHLLEIKIGGETRILGASSLDGCYMYSPQVVRTYSQLSVMSNELDRVIPFLTKVPKQNNSQTKEAPFVNEFCEVGNSIPKARKVRFNSLDAAIDKAVKKAGSTMISAVFPQLKELALNEELPFKGEIDGDKLIYSSDENTLKKLSKDALRQRLKRMYS